MTAQRLLSKQGDFEDLVGTTLFESDPVLISKQRIQDYCRSLGQMDWFHFDEARCAESEFGAIVAPGTLTFALIHATFFQNVTLRGLKALFVGSDRFRVIRPVKAGEALVLRLDVANCLPRDGAFRVRYDFEWRSHDNAQMVSTGSFLVQYWEQPEDTTTP